MKRGFLVTAIMILLLLVVLVNLDSPTKDVQFAPTPCDLDDDGFQSLSCGGLDCYDNLQSYTINETSFCNEDNGATLLRAYGEPAGNNEIHDHTWLLGKNLDYNLYFQWDEDSNQNTDIAHFVSTNLSKILTDGTVLEGDTNTFRHSLWAPHVIEHNDLYYMFVTGVERGTPSGNTQRIALATSEDAYNWEWYPINNCPGTTGDGCIYECDEPWTMWGRGLSNDDQCRDPMVIRDDINNRWVMFTTTRINHTVDVDYYSNSEVISVAYSTDLINWTGAGFLRNSASFWLNPQSTQNHGGAAENPFVTEYNGTYYLFFTDTGDADRELIDGSMVQYLASPTLEADSSGSLNWEYRGHYPDLGVNALEIQNIGGDTWISSQRISNSNSPWIGDYGKLLLRRMNWKPGGNISMSNITSPYCKIPSSYINPNATDVAFNNVDEDCNLVDSNFNHPSLLFGIEDIPSLKTSLVSNSNRKNAFNNIKSRADFLVSLGYTANDKELWVGQDNGIHNIPRLGLAYLLSDYSNPNKINYQQRCIEATLHLANTTNELGQEDINSPEDPFKASMQLYSLAYGYDLCFDGATQQERDTIIQEIVPYLEDMTFIYYNMWEQYKYAPYTFNKGIMAGSVGGLAAIVISEDYNDSQLIQNTLNYADTVVSANLNHSLGEDGSFTEGELYGAWSMRFLVPYIEARYRYDGYDYSLLPNIINFDKSVVYNVKPDDSTRITTLNDALSSTRPLAFHNTYFEWAQYKYDSIYSKWIWDRAIKGRTYFASSDLFSTVLWNQNNKQELNPSNNMDKSILLDHRGLYYYKTGLPSNQEIYTNDTLFSFYSGKFQGGHAQEDQGQFTLFSKNENFIVDNGIAVYDQTKDGKAGKTDAHNLVLIDGKGQHYAASLGGTDGIIKKYLFNNNLDYIHSDLSSAYANLSEFNADGYPFPGSDWSSWRRNSNPVIKADRHIFVIKDEDYGEYFIIVDDINKNNTLRDYSLMLHTGEQNTWNYSSNPITITGTNQGNILDVYFGNPDFTTLTFNEELFDNENDDPESERLNITTNAINPYFIYMLNPRSESEPQPFFSQFDIQGGKATAINKGNNSFIGILFISNESVMEYATLKTDANMAFLYGNSSPNPPYLLLDGSFYNGTYNYLDIQNGKASVSYNDGSLSISDITLDYKIYGPNVTNISYKNETYPCLISNTSVCRKNPSFPNYVFVNNYLQSEVTTNETSNSIQLNFTQGINSFSIPFALDDYSINSIFSNDLQNIEGIYTYTPSTSWQIYDNNIEIYDITTLDPKRGYIIKTTSTFSINLTESNNSITNLNLEQGWNLIGLNNITEQSINSELNNQTINSVWEINGNNFNELDINTDTLKPGKAYWIESNQAIQFSRTSNYLWKVIIPLILMLLIIYGFNKSKKYIFN